MRVVTKEEDFSQFQQRVEREVLSHPIILNNDYCNWFRQGELNLDQVRDFTVQFSVFSNLFLVAQLKKMINSPTLSSMRSAKEILASEIGVGFNSKGKTDTSLDDEIVVEGSVEGGTFRFSAAHFEWLLKFAAPLGLEFKDLGKRQLGTRATLHFCDELERIYGSDDPSTSAGAGFAIENWANRGFWKDLISGLKVVKRDHLPELHLGFFIWHDLVEEQHAEHTQEELEEAFMGEEFELDREKFIKGGQEMLNALQVFWQGLNIEREMSRPKENALRQGPA